VLELQVKATLVVVVVELLSSPAVEVAELAEQVELRLELLVVLAEQVVLLPLREVL
jgi:hypothetical protein